MLLIHDHLNVIFTFKHSFLFTHIVQMSQQSVVRVEAVEVAALSVFYQELAGCSQSPPSNLPLIHFDSLYGSKYQSITLLMCYLI